MTLCNLRVLDLQAPISVLLSFEILRRTHVISLVQKLIIQKQYKPEDQCAKRDTRAFHDRSCGVSGNSYYLSFYHDTHSNGGPLFNSFFLRKEAMHTDHQFHGSNSWRPRVLDAGSLSIEVSGRVIGRGCETDRSIQSKSGLLHHSLIGHPFGREFSKNPSQLLVHTLSYRDVSGTREYEVLSSYGPRDRS